MPENRRRFRNPVARSPLLRKGGPHIVSRSGKRQNQRQALEAELDNWWEESDELDWQTEESVSEDTDSSHKRQTFPTVTNPNESTPLPFHCRP